MVFMGVLRIIICKAFLSNSKGDALVWFKSFRPLSVIYWEELSCQFIKKLTMHRHPSDNEYLAIHWDNKNVNPCGILFLDFTKDYNDSKFVIEMRCTAPWTFIPLLIASVTSNQFNWISSSSYELCSWGRRSSFLFQATRMKNRPHRRKKVGNENLEAREKRPPMNMKPLIVWLRHER